MVLKEKLQTAIEELGIANAFTWEGSARCYIPKDLQENQTEVQINVYGSSGVEHDGDIQGINSNIMDLKGQAIEIDSTSFKVIQTSFEYVYDEEDHNYINVKGYVIIKISAV